MADTIRTLSALQTLLADNTTQAITPQNLRDFLVSVDGSKYVVSKTTTYSATASDVVILCSTAGGAWTLTLPAAASNTHKCYYIKKTTSDSNALTIDANASELIDGALTQVITAQYVSITIVCDGSNWYII